MTGFGGKLRQAREGRSVPLRQIATKTKPSLEPEEAVRQFHERFGDNPPAGAASPAATLGDEDLQRRRTGIIVKIVIAGFLAAVVVLYFSWRRAASDGRSTPDPRAEVGKAASHCQLPASPWILDSVRL